MVSARIVSYILTIIWLITFLVLRKKLFTAKWYFYLLFVMSSAGIVLELDEYVDYGTQTYSIVNIILFAILQLCALIPWLKYDNSLKKVKFTINDKNIKTLKILYIILTLLSIWCIIYCLPYAILANTIGGLEIRSAGDGGVLPRTFLTTIASGIAALVPIGLLLFFVGLLDNRLKKYAFWVLLLPIAGILESMACMARELYIYIPIIFVFLYFVFANSLAKKMKKLLKKISFLFLVIFLIFLLIITISRFGPIASKNFITGTWGYFYQQPYVFDQTLQHFDNYKGFSKNLKFLDGIIPNDIKYYGVEMKTEWSFGTMYKGFYEMFGYTSLFIGTIVYIFFFYFTIRKSVFKKNPFSILVNFSIFLWLTISGLFYFRYGINNSYFILYLSMILLSHLFPKYLKVEYL